jgi:hypothetical protein
MVISLLLTIVFDIGLAIVIFQVARQHGMSKFVSYLLSSIGPLLGMAISILRTRRLGGVSIIILAEILISALVALIGSHDPTILLLKDSVETGRFGLVVLISALPVFPKPLLFFFALKFGTDGTKQGVGWFYELWDKYASFRRSQYVINTVWGAGFLLEAGLKALGVRLFSYDTAFTFNKFAPFVVLAALISWTIWYAGRVRRAGEARAVNAQQA